MEPRQQERPMLTVSVVRRYAFAPHATLLAWIFAMLGNISAFSILMSPSVKQELLFTVACTLYGVAFCFWMFSRSYGGRHDNWYKLEKRDWLYCDVTSAAAHRLLDVPQHFFARALLKNGTCPSDVVERLAFSNGVDIALTAIAHPNFDVSTMGPKVIAKRDYSDYVRAVLNLPGCPESVFFDVYNTGKQSHLNMMVRLSCTPEEIINEIVSRFVNGEELNLETVELALRHKKCAPETLTRMASHTTEESLLRSVVLNRNCPADILSGLALSESSKIRAVVAEHPNTPLRAKTLATLTTT